MNKIVLLMSLILIGISLGNKVDQITSPDKSLVLKRCIDKLLEGVN